MVPRSMPTTLLISPLAQTELPLDAREQVVDVVALEKPLAQRFEHRALRSPSPRSRSTSASHRADSSASCSSCSARFASIGWRARSSRGFQASAGAPPPAQLPDLIQLLVQREHFLEQRRRHLTRRLFRAFRRQALPSLQQVFDARHRLAQRAIRVVQIRRPLEAGAPLGRRRVVEVVRDETAG